MKRKFRKSSKKVNKSTVGLMSKKSFRREQQDGSTNSMITKEVFEPFRISDGKMIVGKHRGRHISELPKNYVQWLINQPNLAQSRKVILEKIV